MTFEIDAEAYAVPEPVEAMTAEQAARMENAIGRTMAKVHLPPSALILAMPNHQRLGVPSFSLHGPAAARVSTGRPLRGTAMDPLGLQAQQQRGDLLLPYGVIPRLMLISLLSEAIETESSIVSFGGDLIDVASRLGIKQLSGGRNGSITRIRAQLRSLMACKIQFRPDRASQWMTVLEHPHVEILRSSDFSKMDSRDADNLLFTDVRFGREFLRHYCSQPIMGAWSEIEAIKQSSLSLDMYVYSREHLARRGAAVWHQSFEHPRFSGAHGHRKARQLMGNCLTKIRNAAPELIEATEQLWRDATRLPSCHSRFHREVLA